MNQFQNIGTFDAGVFTPGLSGGTAGGAGVPTMDAAGIASGGAFLVSELEKRDPLLRKPLTSYTYPRDININTGGGWVDYVSAMSAGQPRRKHTGVKSTYVLKLIHCLLLLYALCMVRMRSSATPSASAGPAH